ncbi:MAG: cytochrome c [Rhodocyclaceae bacterium]|nr:cytochrome c [Rhodocyclaceae bacterium]
MKRHGVRAAAVSLMLLGAATASPMAAAVDLPSDVDFPHRDSPEARVYRGSIVFSNYCVLCHGQNADGKGRAAKLYTPPPANLRKSDKTDEYKELIIRRGGAPMARSEFMPPWGAELTEEQISDVVSFLRSIAPEDAPR